MKRLAIAVLVVLAPLAAPASARAGDSRVFVVMMENKEYGQIIGSGDAPYTNRLADRYASLTRMYGIRHPSLPNYLATIGGSTFGVSSNCTSCDGIRSQSFADQLEGTGVSWRAYMEGMPSACFRGATSGRYVKRHNPFAYFRDVYGDNSCKRVVPADKLDDHARVGKLGDFNWITPDQCHNTHDCDVRTGDRYLSHLIPKLLDWTGPRGFVVLTYDEGSSGAGCCGNARGGRIATVLAGPGVRRGADVSQPYTLYSLLRSLEDVFGVGHLKEAGCSCAAPMDAVFEGGLPRLGRLPDGSPVPPPPPPDTTPPQAWLARAEGDGTRLVRFALADDRSGVDPDAVLGEHSADGGESWQPLDDPAYDALAAAYTARIPVEAGEGRMRVRLTARDREGNEVKAGFVTPLEIIVDTQAPAGPALGPAAQALNVNDFALEVRRAEGAEEAKRLHVRLCRQSDPHDCRVVTIDLVAGQTPHAVLPSAGRYVAWAWLEDRFGNADPRLASNAVSLLFDPRAPVGAFEPPRDREVAATLDDGAEGSGLASCRIEAKAVGEETFRPTQGSRLEAGGTRCLARLPSSEFPAGTYDLRALVADNTGNSTMIDKFSGGAPATLTLRYASHLQISPPQMPVPSDESTTIALRLSDPRGPIANAQLNVTVRTPEEDPQRWNEETEPDGTALVELPPGPTRRITLRFLGDEERRGVERTLTVLTEDQRARTALMSTRKGCRRRKTRGRRRGRRCPAHGGRRSSRRSDERGRARSGR
jgi:hypothetical protein